jgi:hypothetical protein
MGAKNPFTPSFGKMPLVMAGRDRLLAEMGDAFDNGLGDPNLATLVTGARGTGKTVLLSAVRAEAVEHGWVAVGTSALPGMLDDILQQTYRAAGHLLAPRRERRLTSLELGQLLGVQWEELERAPENWRTKMTGLLDQLADAGAGLLVTVDEAVPQNDEMRTLATVYQHFVCEERNVALVMAGLPHNVSALASDGAVSFLRRARRQRLGRIADRDVRHAFWQTVEQGGKAIEGEALDLAVEASEGFPFMMQLVGYWVWACSGSAPAIDAAHAAQGIAQARDEMRDGVLESTLRDLSAGDRRFLAAMLEDEGPSALADVARRLGRPSNYAAQYKRRLLEQGVIGEDADGKLHFELPMSRTFFAERLASVAPQGD